MITQDEQLILVGSNYLLLIKLRPERLFRDITQTVPHSTPLFSPKQDQGAVQGVNYFLLSLFFPLFFSVSNYGFLIKLIFWFSAIYKLYFQRIRFWCSPANLSLRTYSQFHGNLSVRPFCYRRFRSLRPGENQNSNNL